jgi:hypothetical protein
MSILGKQLIPLYMLGGIMVLTPAISSLDAVPYFGYKSEIYRTLPSSQGGGDTTHPTWILSGHLAGNLINKSKDYFNQTNPVNGSMASYKGNMNMTGNSNSKSLSDTVLGRFTIGSK